MFGKLKDKLKKWVGKVSEVEEVEEKVKNKDKVEADVKISKNKEKKTKEKKKEKKAKSKKTTSKKKEEITKTEIEEDKIEEQLKKELETGEYVEPEKTFNAGMETFVPDIEKTVEVKKHKTSFFKKLTSSKKTISENEFNEYSEDLEMILLENNVALEVAEKIIEDLKQEIVGKELSKKEIENTITESLKKIIEEVLIEPFDILEEIKEKKEPYVILFCGINGTGKTTHIAKVANMLKEKKISCVLAAGDTFRAAAVEQLKQHGDNLNLKVISQDYGSDPAAVGYDAVKYAKKNKIDVVLIDTAGRIHTATNLLQEMQKIKKVTKPDRTIFVGESITGNDATDQVKAFNENIGIDGIILSKADIDEKGGTALSVGYTTGKPILFLGIGQDYNDIQKFNKKKFIEGLGL